MEIFPLTTYEDSHEEAADKVAATLRQFCSDDQEGRELADLLKSTASLAEQERAEPLSDLLGAAIDMLYERCPRNVVFGYFDEIEGYGFASRKEAKEEWEAMWPEELCNEAAASVQDACRERYSR